MLDRVRRRCDNNADTTADLAVALGNFAAEFAPTFMLDNFWLILPESVDGVRRLWQRLLT